MTDNHKKVQSLMKLEQAEEALSHAYYLVMGVSPPWSESFGYQEALQDMADACKILRQLANIGGKP